MEDSAAGPDKAKRKCYSRPHTKEERKQEKKRHRERKKLFKRQAKRQAVGIAGESDVGGNSANQELVGAQKVDQSIQTEGPLENKIDESPKITAIERKDISPLEKSQIIGSGTYGICYKGYYRGNIPVVIKTFRQSILKSEVTREAAAIEELQKLKHHESLPLLFGINLETLPFLLVTQLHTTQDEHTNTLSQAMKDQLLGRSELMDVIIQISRTLGYIHSRGWLHNDLKENNIVLHVLSGKWNPVIIDFGKSVLIKKAQVKRKRNPDSSKYPWIAPEVLEGRSAPSVSSDVFSLGLMTKHILKVMKVRAESLYSSCLSLNPEDCPKNAHIVAVSLLRFKKSILSK